MTASFREVEPYSGRNISWEKKTPREKLDLIAATIDETLIQDVQYIMLCRTKPGETLDDCSLQALQKHILDLTEGLRVIQKVCSSPSDQLLPIDHRYPDNPIIALDLLRKE